MESVALMEGILNIFSAENVRMLATLVFGFSCMVWLKTSLNKKIDGLDRKIDNVEASLNKKIDELKYNDLAAIHRRIDGVEVSINELRVYMDGRINELKNNDFAHLNGTIEALTYALEKNGSLGKEDKEFVDSRLAR